MMKKQQLSDRIARITDMLCDCMSVAAAEAERANIIKLIEQGKSDQEIYQKIAWG
ncbi:hypothetical protein [Phaeodactylibacter xiamenensis]|uniref:hypothetical protein n=1 Tax=Phaeodactylibacter xiamenensis TaxID=1524460 RepID=UPI0024A9EF7D|nr:hypothetical protein [Phaeodactylibacter xiamenensis]